MMHVPCRNVIKLSFHSSLENGDQHGSLGSSVRGIRRGPSLPVMHPSLSSDSLNSVNALETVDPAVVIIPPLPNDTIVRPPPGKQLADVQTLIRQYHERWGEGVEYLYLIHTPWLESWSRFVHGVVNGKQESPDPGAITNFRLVDASHQQEVAGEETNEQSIQFKAFILRTDLQEGVDFFLVPKDCWEALANWYGGGPCLPRFLFNTLHFGFVYPCHPQLQKLLFENIIMPLTFSVMPNVSTGAAAANSFIDHRATLFMDLYPSPGSVPTPADIEEYIRSKNENVRAAMRSLSIEHQEKEKEGETSAEEESPETKTEGAGSASACATRPSFAQAAGLCVVCGQECSQRCAQCSKLFYCHVDCQRVHWKYHRQVCKKMKELVGSEEQLIDPRLMVPITLNGRNGKVGLFNLGNSCYMNSSLQCLSHIRPLTAEFLSQRFAKQVNRGNKDGTGGELAMCYNLLLQELWFESKRAVQPNAFKNLLGKINPEYSGLAQQDAHETIELLLDKLHEDLNRVKQKPYTVKVEGNGTDDFAIARETWKRHDQRESSLIKDFMGSLMRSQLTCPTCGKVSVSYEYHNTVQIAIPRNNHVTVQVTFVPEVPSGRCQEFDEPALAHALRKEFNPVVMSITLDRLCTVKALKQMIFERVPAAFLQLSGGMLVLLEVPGSDLPSQQHKLRPVKLLKDSVVVYTLSPSNTIYACSGLTNLDEKALVYLRRPLSESPSGKDLSMHVSFFQFPLLLSFDGSWNCRRLALHIWINLLRFCDAQSRYVGEAREFLQRMDVKSLFRLAEQFSIRLVDANGAGAAASAAFLKKQVRTKEEVALDLAFGCKLPVSSTDVTVVQFIGEQGRWVTTGVVFLAVDFQEGLFSESQIRSLCATSRSTYNSSSSSSSSSSRSQSRSRSISLSGLTLEECLGEHTKEEQLDPGNEWYCSQCQQHKQAWKIVSFCLQYMPRVLILTLKRFEYRQVLMSMGYSARSPGMHREKIDSYVDFPLDGLDLRPFCGEEVCDDGAILYDLFAVCNHYGRMGFGHYTAIARDWLDDNSLDDKWFQFDDDNVTTCPTKEVKSSSAYILFYRRRS